MPRAAGLDSAARVHPAQEPLVPTTQKPALLTLAPQGGPRSLVLVDSPEHECQVDELELPSIPDTFTAARNLIAMMASQSPASRDRPLVLQCGAPSRSKPRMDPEPATGAEPTVGTEEHGTEQDLPREPEGQEFPVPLLALSSSSLDEAVAGTSSSGLPPIDSLAHQDLLRRVPHNMGLQAEEVVKSEDLVVDILAPEGPLSMTLPLIKTI
ncbi:hypothetical protein UY3_00149 [Chelonia mydas]|uniref:Uncharacterized protein n=1 Tax=Chelonia mydas TaxID=8469 RepID=M7BXJ0_CHEMY|nr:hypothetical protein UY3_00149 [Chelonia mydas]